MKLTTTLAAVAAAITLPLCAAQAQDNMTNTGSGIMAGAAKIDVTPAVSELPEPLTSVHDPLFVRALMVESAGERAAIIVIDTPAIIADTYAQLMDEISTTFDIPKGHIMLSTTHTHNSMRVAPPGPSPIPVSEVFTNNVLSGTIEALKQAKANLEPAKAGYSSGESSLVSGRDQWWPSQNRYIDGIDRTGKEPVDRTFGVYEFSDLEDNPIAAVINFGIEPVVFEQAHDQVSGDVPGATSNYVEEAFDGDMVALFTIGSPSTPTYRVWPEDSEKRRIELGEKIMEAMGVILGEETLAQMASIEGSTAPIKIASAQETLTCEGKKTTPRNLRNHCAITADSDLPACDHKDEPFKDVTLSMNLMQLGDATYFVADGNMVAPLWEKVKAQSPVSNLSFVGANFGPFRFVVDDRSYQLNTYPATDTRAVRNCAEAGVLADFHTMLENLK